MYIEPFKMEKILNYINGGWHENVHLSTIEVIEPATSNSFGTIPLSDSATIDVAVMAAEAAFLSWSNTQLEERSKWLNRIADGIEARMDEFVVAESKDSGKPESLARRVDIPRAIANFRFFAGAVQHMASESHYTPQSGINYTLRKPLGVVGCISPWNLPLYLFSWKIAPALAAGNCVIAKPSDVTPYTAYLLADVCREIGLPKGVLNIVHGGVETGKHIVSHPAIKAISFTGSTRAGEDIARTAAPMFKKLSLELGGKNPTLIFEDADFETNIDTIVRSGFSNQGQICLCGSRILVHEKIAEKFTSLFVEKIRQLKVGDPQDFTSNIGALVSETHMQKVLSCIDLAKNEGGSILTGGNQVQVGGRCANGYFVAPTVISNLTHDCRTNKEEIFGPVVTIGKFSSEEEAITMSNVVDYGLSCSIWTNDLTRAHRVADRITCGIVWVNSWMERDLRTPFGGVKNSGIGREGGWEAMRFFTEPKNVFIKY
jgi:aminomuconate-semialdehyde/2-hydroxymuconate-6-semialdehyde dehydrogenase